MDLLFIFVTMHRTQFKKSSLKRKAKGKRSIHVCVGILAYIHWVGSGCIYLVFANHTVSKVFWGGSYKHVLQHPKVDSNTIAFTLGYVSALGGAAPASSATVDVRVEFSVCVSLKFTFKKSIRSTVTAFSSSLLCASYKYVSRTRLFPSVTWSISFQVAVFWPVTPTRMRSDSHAASI